MFLPLFRRVECVRGSLGETMTMNGAAFGRLIEKFESAASVAETWALLLAHSRPLGMRYGIITELPERDESLYDIAICADVLPQWRERYTRLAYHRRDPIVLHGAFVDRSYTWAEAAAHPRYDVGQRQLVEERREFAIHGGFTTPVTLGRRTAIVSLCGENPVLAPGERALLHAASVCALSRIYALTRRRAEPREDVALPARQRECLSWAAAGKSDWEIGDILSLSNKTVSTYIQRAKARYNVATRMQAVICALKRGDIEA